MCKRFIFIFLLFFLSCTAIPDNIRPVEDFEVNRYLGRWYEIVRLDHSFERGLERVTADYSLRDDGGINVLNRGFDPAGNKWKEADGKAYFIDKPSTGRLKVSFFGPFYGGYNIIDLDREAYTYAMVCGPSLSYFWILAREPEMGEYLKSRLVHKAESMGFDTDALVHVIH